MEKNHGSEARQLTARAEQGPAAARGFTEEGAQLLAPRLRALLERQALRYTVGESTSLREETAEALYNSLCYTLGAFAQTAPDGTQALCGDLDMALQAGQKILRGRVRRAESLYRSVCATARSFGNIAYADTLRGMRAFFAGYDVRFFAHEIPCTIDYPLCDPVPESLLGVDYLLEYLRRLGRENQFCARFPIGAVEALLRRAVPDAREQLVNLYEFVAVQAVGLSVIEKSIYTLGIDETERAALQSRLENEGCAQAFARAVSRVSHAMELDEAATRYLDAAARAAVPRVQAALTSGELRQAFP